MEIDFALIGHQESWRAAADVLAVLRGPRRAPLLDEEIKDILPWIPPRAVCHVDVGSIANAKARGVYKGRKPKIDSAVVNKLRYEEKLGPADIARRLGIGRASVYRVLGKKGAA